VRYKPLKHEHCFPHFGIWLMDISQFIEYPYIASGVTGDVLEAILYSDPGLVIRMIV
jgi:hypothetical protein